MATTFTPGQMVSHVEHSRTVTAEVVSTRLLQGTYELVTVVAEDRTRPYDIWAGALS